MNRAVSALRQPLRAAEAPLRRTVSIDTLVFALVVVSGCIGLWADTVRGWLAW